jgi:hypothetical protein
MSDGSNPYNPLMHRPWPDIHAGRTVHVWRRVAAQPNWVLRAALMTFLIVLALPMLLLLLAAMLLSVLVFGSLALFHALGEGWRRLFGGRPRDLAHAEGRRNVRVIRHDEHLP